MTPQNKLTDRGKRHSEVGNEGVGEFSMAVIGFSDERAWVKARWAVSRVLEDMLVLCPEDAQLTAVLHAALESTGGICVDLLEKAIADRFVEVLKDVISATLDESRPNRLRWTTGLDENSQSQYKEAIKELGEMLQR
jgi:hypothetical protein